LVTSFSGRYESGVFDLGSGQPRPTALAQTVRALAEGKSDVHPSTPRYGWWRQSRRLLYPPIIDGDESGPPDVTSTTPLNTGPPLLITGAAGTLGRSFANACFHRGLHHVACTRHDLDITDKASIEAAIADHHPWAIINTAGFVRVDDAESDAAVCRRINTLGAVNLAEICRRHGVKLLTFSSDLVFAGEQSSPYIEHDRVRPLSVYGQSKADAEQEVLSRNTDALVIRTSAFFSAADEYNFLTLALEQIQRGSRFRAAKDWIVSPTYVPDLVNRSLDLLIDGEADIWHLANEGAVSWAEFARRGAVAKGLDADRVTSCPAIELGFRARRPPFSVLGSQQGSLLPSLDDAILRYVAERAMVQETAYHGSLAAVG